MNNIYYDNIYYATIYTFLYKFCILFIKNLIFRKEINKLDKMLITLFKFVKHLFDC